MRKSVKPTSYWQQKRRRTGLYAMAVENLSLQNMLVATLAANIPEELGGVLVAIVVPTDRGVLVRGSRYVTWLDLQIRKRVLISIYLSACTHNQLNI